MNSLNRSLTPRQARSPRLPIVSETEPSHQTELWLPSSRASSARSRGTRVRFRAESAQTQSTTSLRPSMVSLDPFNSFKVNDLTNYTMNDQRWTLQRKKIGLKRRTHGAQERRVRNRKSHNINLEFIRSHFTRKECMKFVLRYEESGQCHCGLEKDDHYTINQLLLPQPKPVSAYMRDFISRDITHDFEEKCNENGIAHTLLNIFNVTKTGIKTNKTKPLDLSETTSPRRDSVTSTIVEDVESGMPAVARKDSVEDLLKASGITPRAIGRWESSRQSTQQAPVAVGPTLIPPAAGADWEPETHLKVLPTNAYGTINFVNEFQGSQKPAKYVRLASDTDMEPVLTLLSDYWRLLDPARPQLVISVAGGAKNFRLDGKKKETFTTGLIKAVKSTSAWILTGGQNVGIMRSVGDAVNQGQYIVKVKRKSFFAEEQEHMSRGIRCLGVSPWGYVKDRDALINSDLNEFAKVKYKVHEEIKRYEPISLNGDHTHFLLVDDGTRNRFRGSDDFRTRLEEAIQAEEPAGLGVPVVLLLLDGGISAVQKCAMALERGIPIVVVAGTGRAADLLTYAYSMTVRTHSGRYVIRKSHHKQLKNRISSLMVELPYKKQQACLDYVIECCSNANMITIFDINCHEGMDKYILYALLTGGTETSRIDQLRLALLWDRPDIAETQILPTKSHWETGVLDDLMTQALLEEKVEFVKLFISNGLVMTEYLTVQALRNLYNQACEPNSHLARLLQKSSRQRHHHLFHVHNLLQAMVRKHFDPIYLADTPLAVEEDTSVNYLTFEDPYQELFLWAIFSRRGRLARCLWERCNTPLCTAVVSTCIYRSLWRSLGAKNTGIREEYQKQKNAFEALAVELLDVSFKEDGMNAMGLVERRNKKWGDLDCLEISLIANDLIFISSPCAQASIELNWRRGMSKAPFFAVIISNFLPFLIFWTKFFRFQRLGDNGGTLTSFQKLVVFYKSPISKFCAHSLSFVLFLLLYAYVILFDFQYEVSLAEKFVIAWICTYVFEKVSEVIITEQSSTIQGKLSDWLDSVWNRFDLVAVILAFIAVGLRSFRQTFKWGRIAYAINTPVFYCRLFRIYHVNYHLGPKLVIFYRMVSEVLVFMALLVIFILGYGIASQALLHPVLPAEELNVTSVGAIMEDVFLTPYWQMYGELLLEELTGNDIESCHQQSCTFTDICSNATGECWSEPDCVCETPREYSWVVSLMLFFYLIIGNIMLLNLLIAIFTYVFDEVQENSMEIWKFEMFRLIREYDFKPSLVPPFVVFEYFWRFSKKLWKLFCRKKKENLEDYMKNTLMSLQIFEKECIATYLARIAHDEENSIDNRVKRMSEKIDKIAKYIEQREDLDEIEDDLEWMMEESQQLDENTKDILSGGWATLESPTDANPPPPQPSRKKSLANINKQNNDDEAEEEKEDDDEADIVEFDGIGGKVDTEDDGESGTALPVLGGLKLDGNHTFKTRSRPGSTVRQRRSNQNLNKVTKRLDYMQGKIQASQTYMEEMMAEIMERLDKLGDGKNQSQDDVDMMTDEIMDLNIFAENETESVTKTEPNSKVASKFVKKKRK